MKKLKSKLALLSGLALAPVAASVGLSGCAKSTYAEYHILAINDLHGAIPGFGEDVSIVDKANPGCFRIQKEVDKVMNQYPGSIFLSAGDENSGDSWSTCSQGQTTYPVLKSMGVRYCAVGNHAFEWGIDDVATGLYDRLGRTDQTEGKYFVNANILSVPGYSTKEYNWTDDESLAKFNSDFEMWNKLRVPWADPYKVINFGNAKVCLIGLTTTGTLTDGNKDVTKNLSFIDYNPSVIYAKHLAKQELGEDKFKEIDSFILFTHCAGDWDAQNETVTGEVAELAANLTTRADAIISAHSHKTYAGTIYNKRWDRNIWISQAGTAGRYLADTKIVVDPRAKAGRRVVDVSMSVKKIDVPADEAQAKKEWNDYCNGNDLYKVAEAFNYEKQWVKQFFTRQLSEAALPSDPKYMQHPDKFTGYYNGIKTKISEITGQKVIPGHDYYDSEEIIEHFGAWLNRCMLLGFYYDYQKLVKFDQATMPSCSFSTQDSYPSQLANGKLTVREVYDMVPYDNKYTISYVDIFQLANIINYSLSGKPDKNQTIGFKYHADHRYVPDLRFYVGCTDATKTEEFDNSKIRVCDDDDKVIDTTNYTCGPLSFAGIQVNLKEITDAERELKITTAKGTQKVFDDTAKYRVNTIRCEDVMVGGQKKVVWLPDIKVFRYQVNEDGTDNIKDLDNPPLPDEPYDPETSSWKDAKWWYAHHQAQYLEMEMIPVITNSFIYNGGNNQNKMFKCYQEYNTNHFMPYYTTFSTNESIREVLEDFFLLSLNTGFDWDVESNKAPTNWSWSDAKRMLNIVQ